MAEVMARAAPGSLIQLDQCRRCGGIWCDKWELFPLDGDEAGRLDAVDEDLLRDSIRLA
jgi:Zn-finger nucleic acid-binding protein